MAIRLAKLEAARVFTTIRGEGNKQIIFSQQEDTPILSKHFKENLLERSNGQSRDLTLNTLGGALTSRNLTLHWMQALSPNVFNIESKIRAQTEILQTGQSIANTGKISDQIS